MYLTGYKLKISLLLLTAVFLLSACGSDYYTDESGNRIYKEIAPTATIDNTLTSDMKSVYASDDDTSVVTMYLTVSRGNSVDGTDYSWDDINAHSVYYYDELAIDRYAVEGILQVGDESGPLAGQFGYGEVAPNSRIQIRGKTSSRSSQKSYKVSINSNEGMWRGQTVINLNKHVYDAVRFRNKLSYDLLKTIPNAFSARTQFVHLYVKDMTDSKSTGNKFVDYGLFTQVEHINKKYLRAHGLDENGQLYKANMFEFLRYEDDIKLITDPSFSQELFDYRLEAKGSDDHSKVIAMLDSLNDYTLPIETVFERYFDADNYFTWLAFQLITGNRDTTSQNFFLYSPLNGNKWYFISWDNDGAWRFGENIEYKGVKGYNYEFGVSNYWGSVLHQRILKSEKYRKMLDDKINELRNVITKQRVSELITKYSELVKPYVYRMPDQLYAPRKTDEYDKILEMMLEEANYNYEMYQMSLKKPMPFFLAVPEVINESTYFAWDAAYDFSGESVTYTFELAKDYHFINPMYKEENLAIPHFNYEKLYPGQYFYRVTARNESGETQTAMEIYSGADDKDHFGVMCFYVQPDGSIGGQ